ncbi:Beta-lactamase-like protein 2 [Coemansia spiralis]|nr:Beta-lactamase-like protein 2 [Coemansia spiralis]
MTPVVRVAAGVVRVLGMNPGPFTLCGTNTYLIGTGERRVLVDTGDGEQSAYFTTLKNCLGGCRIGQILLTHWHADHIGGVSRLLDMPDLVTPDCSVHKCPDAVTDSSDDVVAMLELATTRDKLRSISDGELFDAGGGLQLQAVFTPGHTSDHMSFTIRPPTDPSALLVLTGDLVLGSGTSVVHNLSQYMDSLQRLLALSPTALLPGHGTIVSGSESGRHNAVRLLEYYIEHRTMRERQIADVLSTPPPDTPPQPRDGGWQVEEVTAVVYPDITDPRLVRAAQNNTRCHLDKLVHDGRAEVRHTDGVDLFRIRSPA